TATVTDLCPFDSCPPGALDFSRGLFSKWSDNPERDAAATAADSPSRADDDDDGGTPAADYHYIYHTVSASSDYNLECTNIEFHLVNAYLHLGRELSNLYIRICTYIIVRTRTCTNRRRFRCSTSPCWLRCPPFRCIVHPEMSPTTWIVFFLIVYNGV
ncbi:hypothetical protein MPER_04695, partial [Moniliophthora perniciosa FA553]